MIFLKMYNRGPVSFKIKKKQKKTEKNQKKTTHTHFDILSDFIFFLLEKEFVVPQMTTAHLQPSDGFSEELK